MNLRRILSVAALALLAIPFMDTPAQAGPVSIGVGVRIGGPPAPVYRPYGPYRGYGPYGRPVVVAPPPVIVRPAPRVIYAPPPVVIQQSPPVVIQQSSAAPVIVNQ